MNFDYFYGSEADQFTFYRIPKMLITSPNFKEVSDSAKLFYGLMLDRMSLSIKNGWFDERKRAYIFFKTKDVMDILGCGTGKATKMFAELEKVGLIERKKQGQGKAAIIYVKKFTSSEDKLPDKIVHQDDSSMAKPVFDKEKDCNFYNDNTRFSEMESLDFSKSKSNYNNINNTELNNTDITSYHITEQNNKTDNVIPEKDKKIDLIRLINDRKRYEALIKQNIDYDIIVKDYDKEWLDEIVAVMIDVICSSSPIIRVNKTEYPQESVKSNYLKINSMHIEYIYLSLQRSNSDIKDMQAYLTTALYRSVNTIKNWYQSQVNHNMYSSTAEKEREVCYG